MPGWRRLRAIPGIGPWTLEMLALYGQGHYDRVPAGDLGYLKLVGRITTGNPRARADEAEVRAFFAPYGEWKGLAGEYLRVAAARGLLPVSPVRARPRVEPLAGQELVRHRLLGVRPPREQLLLEHPVGVGAATRPGPGSRTGARSSSGKNTGSVASHRRLLEPAVEARVGGEQPVDPDLRVLCAASRGRARSPA